MSATDDVIIDSIRYIRASERIGATLPGLENVIRLINAVLEVCPELAPEMNAAKHDIKETVDHLQSALATLSVKVDLL